MVGRAEIDDEPEHWSEGEQHHRSARRGGEADGEQQRVAIARAVAKQPEILLCDEPTGDLDRKSGDEVLDLLQALNREQGKTIITYYMDADNDGLGDLWNPRSAYPAGGGTPQPLFVACVDSGCNTPQPITSKPSVARHIEQRAEASDLALFLCSSRCPQSLLEYGIVLLPRSRGRVSLSLR